MKSLALLAGLLLVSLSSFAQTFTGNPTVQDLPVKDSSSKVANTKYVDRAVKNGGGGSTPNLAAVTAVNSITSIPIGLNGAAATTNFPLSITNAGETSSFPTAPTNFALKLINGATGNNFGIGFYGSNGTSLEGSIYSYGDQHLVIKPSGQLYLNGPAGFTLLNTGNGYCDSYGSINNTAALGGGFKGRLYYYAPTTLSTALNTYLVFGGVFDGETYYDSGLGQFQFRESGTWKGLGGVQTGVQKLASQLAGKKFLCIGDSFTGYGVYQDTMAFYTGVTYVNDGVIGCTLSGGSSNHTTIKPMVDRIDADLTANPAANGLIIQGGSNDFALGVPIGDINSTDTLSFCGSLKYIIQKALAYEVAQSRDVQIMYLNPMMRTQGGSRAQYDQQLKYVKAANEVCNYYSIPVIDAFNSSGINYENISFYTVDGLHPSNGPGKSKFGKFVAENVLSPIVPGVNKDAKHFTYTGNGNTTYTATLADNIIVANNGSANLVITVVNPTLYKGHTFSVMRSYDGLSTGTVGLSTPSGQFVIPSTGVLGTGGTVSVGATGAAGSRPT